VLLVGGSTRMPMVQQMLEQESGMRVDRSVSADEAVAHGAAIYAGLLLSARAGHAPKLTIHNVNSHSLGVLAREPQTGRSRNSVIIPRNTVLPVTRGKMFRTFRANQRNVEINVIEGGDSTGKNSTPIGRCIIRDLPRELPAKSPVEVFFTYAENGRLTVQARLAGANREASTTIERSSGLTDAKLQEWDHRLRRQVELTE
jgi:molecular chaperone DnaK